MLGILMYVTKAVTDDLRDKPLTSRFTQAASNSPIVLAVFSALMLVRRQRLLQRHRDQLPVTPRR